MPRSMQINGSLDLDGLYALGQITNSLSDLTIAVGVDLDTPATMRKSLEEGADRGLASRAASTMILKCVFTVILCDRFPAVFHRSTK